MKPHILLLMILVVVLAAVGLAPQVQAAPATGPSQFMSPLKPVHTSYKYKGQTANAYFSQQTSECIYRDVSLFASQNVSKSGPGKPASGQSVNVSVFEYDNCTGDLIKYLYGYASVDNNSFQMDKQLNGAHVKSTVAVTDGLTGASSNLSIDFTWTGVGAVSKNKSQYSYNSAGCKYSSRSNGTYRQANATGTISDGVTNYANGFAFADLQSAKSGDMSIGCGN